jgi:hypothetical protein
MSDQPFDPDVYTKAGVITKSYYRDVYPAVNPTRPDLSQAGKVTIVTGAGRGIGVVCLPTLLSRNALMCKEPHFN